ncbi:MAG: C-GCAxxG-C-C family protein [Pseudoflavonifractor sp.]
MKYGEDAAALRGDRTRHYNCCQAVLMPFAERCGITREQAYSMGAHFGGGMRCGSTCGAVTGGLMVLGLLDRDQGAAGRLMDGFRAKNGVLDCAGLLQNAQARGLDRKTHCDGAVQDAVALLEEILG